MLLDETEIGRPRQGRGGHRGPFDEQVPDPFELILKSALGHENRRDLASKPEVSGEAPELIQGVLGARDEELRERLPHPRIDRGPEGEGHEPHRDVVLSDEQPLHTTHGNRGGANRVSTISS